MSQKRKNIVEKEKEQLGELSAGNKSQSVSDLVDELKGLQAKVADCVPFSDFLNWSNSATIGAIPPSLRVRDFSSGAAGSDSCGKEKSENDQELPFIFLS